MAVAVGVWMALAGALALLVGLAARHHARRLRRDGVRVWAVTMRQSLDDGGEQVTMRYPLADGRAVERPVPARTKRAAPLLPGDKVLIWYDPADPAEVLVYGREGRVSDLAFVVVGVILILAGAALAIIAP
jgi:hypothetical protein